MSCCIATVFRETKKPVCWNLPSCSENGLDYSTPSLTAAQIRTRVKEVLEELLNSDINKAEKLALLNRNVLGDQYIRQLNIAAFREILNFIENNILPFINDKSTSGQDLLNLFL